MTSLDPIPLTARMGMSFGHVATGCAGRPCATKGGTIGSRNIEKSTLQIVNARPIICEVVLIASGQPGLANAGGQLDAVASGGCLSGSSPPGIRRERWLIASNLSGYTWGLLELSKLL